MRSAVFASFGFGILAGALLFSSTTQAEPPVCPAAVSYPAEPATIHIRRGDATITITASPLEIFMTADPGRARRISVVPIGDE